MEKPLDMEELGEGGRTFLLRETGGADVESLADDLESHRCRTEEMIDEILARSAPGGDGDEAEA
jgi:glutamate-ammonia-ligase adenylyltransferase